MKNYNFNLVLGNKCFFLIYLFLNSIAYCIRNTLEAQILLYLKFLRLHFLRLVLPLLFISSVVMLYASAGRLHLDSNFQSVQTAVFPWRPLSAGGFSPEYLTKFPKPLNRKGKQSWYEAFMYWYWSSNSYLLFKRTMSKIELIIVYKLMPSLVFSLSCSEQGIPPATQAWNLLSSLLLIL